MMQLVSAIHKHDGPATGVTSDWEYRTKASLDHLCRPAAHQGVQQQALGAHQATEGPLPPANARALLAPANLVAAAAAAVDVVSRELLPEVTGPRHHQ